MTLNVSLTPQLEELVRAKVASGMYNSASEVLREALRLMEEQDRFRQIKLERLRKDITDGIDSGPGTAWDPEEIKREARKMKASKTRPDSK